MVSHFENKQTLCSSSSFFCSCSIPYVSGLNQFLPKCSHFSTQSFLPHLSAGTLIKENQCPHFSSICVYLLIIKDSVISYFIWWITIRCGTHLFWCSKYPRNGQWEPHQAVSNVLSACHYFWTLSYSLSHQDVPASSGPFLPYPWNQIFL